ncbi:serine/threonine-protein phosphatase 6 regulatory subunit 3 isoform X2 [Agrilus planipennis]|uniref:Serine/threonine-protein phosphatase 6 regulatory subunit 3 isoform X2 n=1 Tax=Agrilus planipennis TaxID=224129 RepID=A0A1W4WLQ5_AGRPL|nr:serine/threonine-protein phosphatase 6 regulatory subunit 3 isoform X2 [Agrilus planipennis]
MFWKYNNGSSSQIETLLAKEGITLKELLNEEDIINECKLQNKALIDFLNRPENLEELVTLATVEPSVEIEERTRFKYPYIACQILVCDIPTLNEGLASNEALLSKLYSFLDSEPPLNSLLASYFSEIMCVLIAMKTEQNWLSHQVTCLQVIYFLKKKENFIPLLLKHIGTSAIMDLTLKLMTQVKGTELRQNILQWLDSQKIVQSLVALLNPSVDKERHYNVAQLLCDFIKTARDIQRNNTERYEPDLLLNTVESAEIIIMLLDQILSSTKVESCIVGGIQVLLALLEFSKPIGVTEETSDAEYKKKIVEIMMPPVLKRLRDFHNLLVDPPKKEPIGMTVGTLQVPVGNTRLKVAKLFATFIATNSSDVIKELMSLGTFQLLLDLFFKYPWNNFLHTQVEACITSALKAPVTYETGDDNALYTHLIVNCKLVERILEAWKNNDEKQSQTNGLRQGYMGHLTNMVNSILNCCSTSSLGEFLKTTVPTVAEEFEKFAESTLQEINKKRDTLLGGANPCVTNDDGDEYGDLPFTQSMLLQQQVYAQYQMQQLTPQFIESYSDNDDDFNDDEDTLQAIDDRTNVNFDLSEGDLVQQHEFFKQICAQNINTLDDADDQIFEDKDHTFQTVIEKKEAGDNCSGFGGYHSSSDSEDGSPPSDNPFVDVDSWLSKSNKPGAVAPISMQDPWSTCEKTADEATSAITAGDCGTNNWADFSSATFAAVFDANFDALPNRTENSNCGTFPNSPAVGKAVLGNVVTPTTATTTINLVKNANEDEVVSKSRRDAAETEVAQIVDQALQEVAKKIGGHVVAAGDGADHRSSNIDSEPKNEAKNELIEGNDSKMTNVDDKTGACIKQEPDKKGA